jgi:hypothetical protein
LKGVHASTESVVCLANAFRSSGEAPCSLPSCYLPCGRTLCTVKRCSQASASFLNRAWWIKRGSSKLAATQTWCITQACPKPINMVLYVGDTYQSHIILGDSDVLYFNDRGWVQRSTVEQVGIKKQVYQELCALAHLAASCCSCRQPQKYAKVSSAVARLAHIQLLHRVTDITSNP